MTVERAFEVPSIVINDLGGILSGTADPSTPGLNAPVGSIYMRDNGGVGEHWKKIGALDNDWELQLEGTGGGGGSGFIGLGLWRYRTEITNNPASGRLQFDDTTVDDATELYVNVTNDGGTDLTVFLQKIISGDFIYIQDQGNSTKFILVEVGNSVLSSGVFIFPILTVESQGAAITNNTTVAFVTSHSGAGAGAGGVIQSGVDEILDGETFTIQARRQSILSGLLSIAGTGCLIIEGTLVLLGEQI